MPKDLTATTTYGGAEVSAQQVLVKIDPGASAEGIAHAIRGIGHLEGPVGIGDWVTLQLDTPLSIDKVLNVLSHLPGVTAAEADYVIRTFDDEDDGPPPGPTVGPVIGPPDDGSEITGYDVSNDPSVTAGTTWGVYGDIGTKTNAFGSQAAEAWTAGYTGSTKVAVGVVDTGVDYTHPDLYLNIWLNQAEIPLSFKASLTDTDGDGRISFRDLNNTANAAYVADQNGNGRIDGGDLLNDTRWEDGLDQDGNGLTDDLIGWDFINNDNDPMDDVGHGTHVAGIIAAQGGNGVGVAGVTWNTQIVVAKFLGPNGGLSSDAIRSLDYVTTASQAAGAIDIVATNNSWGAPVSPVSLQDAIVRGAQAGILFVAAAGNGGADIIGDNNDNTPNYPSNYDTVAGAGYDAVIAVASITNTGTRSSFSNYGATSVDLGAPGSTIYSTLPGGTYGNQSGTSMATPFVTGAIAAYAAAVPGASPTQIRADLLASTIPTASLTGLTVTGGRLDVSSFIYRGNPNGVTITGTALADTVSMTATVVGQSKASVFNDSLVGLDGADKLDGGLGADKLTGGPGNDTYTVDNANDVVVEVVSEGTDTANSSINYVLPANVENLTLTGTAPLTGTGNELANTLTGNAAANLLDGGLGNDVLNGNDGADTLVGGAGNDKLAAGTGADSMAGGVGDDSYDVDNAGDVVFEQPGEGNDLVNSAITYALGADVEKLTLTGVAAINGTGNGLGNTLNGNAASNVLDGGLGDDTLNGLAGADTLVGGAGNDKLTGGTEADSMSGGAGNDTYYVDDPGDVVFENANEGDELVNSSVTYTLAVNVERMTLTGVAAINATGNTLGNTLAGNTGDNVLTGLEGTDTLTGGSGADTLIGGADADKLTGGLGADRMEGGAADDTYYVDDPGDVVVEVAGEGANDLISSSVTYTLPDEVEKLTLSGTSAVDAAGNGLANTITGNSAANHLNGGAGADTISAGSGDDTLDGGTGADRLTGSTGADRFYFQAGEAAGDTVTDFAAGEHLEFHGYGAGSTLTRVVGSLTDWVITDGVTHATEVITLTNKYALAAGDYIFS